MYVCDVDVSVTAKLLERLTRSFFAERILRRNDLLTRLDSGRTSIIVKKMGTLPGVKQTTMFQLWQFIRMQCARRYGFRQLAAKKHVVNQRLLPSHLRSLIGCNRSRRDNQQKLPPQKMLKGGQKRKSHSPPPTHLISNKIEGSCGPRVEYMEILNALDETEFEAKTRVLLN